MIVYVWARRNPQVMMNFLGIFNFTAPFMPWVLLAFSLLLSGQLPVADLIGIVVGHVYYYLADVYPLLYGHRPLATPRLLVLLLDPPADAALGLGLAGGEGEGEGEGEGRGEGIGRQGAENRDQPPDPFYDADE